MSRFRNITRMDYASRGGYWTRGWWVRLRRRTKLHTKFFSDEKCGGRDGALKQAQAWRDGMDSVLPKPLTKLTEPRVRRCVVRNYVYFAVRWQFRNVRLFCGFGVGRYGESGARLEAESKAALWSAGVRNPALLDEPRSHCGAVSGLLDRACGNEFPGSDWVVPREVHHAYESAEGCE
jgi:hypothetical protein